MTRPASVAETRRDLPRLLREVEAGAEVRITRRGKPVAVLISIEGFHRLAGGGPPFAEAWRTWRREVPDGDLDEHGDAFADVRERGDGREIDL